MQVEARDAGKSRMHHADSAKWLDLALGQRRETFFDIAHSPAGSRRRLRGLGNKCVSRLPPVRHALGNYPTGICMYMNQGEESAAESVCSPNPKRGAGVLLQTVRHGSRGRATSLSHAFRHLCPARRRQATRPPHTPSPPPPASVCRARKETI